MCYNTAILTKSGKVLHKFMNTRRKQSLGAILEASDHIPQSTPSTKGFQKEYLRLSHLFAGLRAKVKEAICNDLSLYHHHKRFWKARLKAASNIRKLWEIPTNHPNQQLWSERLSRGYHWLSQLHTVSKDHSLESTLNLLRTSHLLRFSYMPALQFHANASHWLTLPEDHREKGDSGKCNSWSLLDDVGSLWKQVVVMLSWPQMIQPSLWGAFNQ